MCTTNSFACYCDLASRSKYNPRSIAYVFWSRVPNLRGGLPGAKTVTYIWRSQGQDCNTATGTMSRLPSLAALSNKASFNGKVDLVKFTLEQWWQYKLYQLGTLSCTLHYMYIITNTIFACVLIHYKFYSVVSAVVIFMSTTGLLLQCTDLVSRWHEGRCSDDHNGCCMSSSRNTPIIASFPDSQTAFSCKQWNTRGWEVESLGKWGSSIS